MKKSETKPKLVRPFKTAQSSAKADPGYEVLKLNDKPVHGPKSKPYQERIHSRIIRIPKPQQERIVAQYILGTSLVAIARKEKRSVNTIRHVVAIKVEKQEEHIKDIQALIMSLGMLSVECIRREITKGKNHTLAERMLQRIGALPRENIQFDANGNVIQAPTLVSLAVNTQNNNATPQSKEEVERAAMMVLYNHLSEVDKIKFRILEMGRQKAEGYGLDYNEFVPEFGQIRVLSYVQSGESCIVPISASIPLRVPGIADASTRSLHSLRTEVL